MNFYCSVVDDQLKHPTDKPTIGLILCQTKDRVLAEYALRGMQQPIGVSDYELTRALPEGLKTSLPSIEELENELSNGANGKNRCSRPLVQHPAMRPSFVGRFHLTFRKDQNVQCLKTLY